MGGCVPDTGVNERAIRAFITTHLALAPLGFRPDILLYGPTPRSGLTAWLIAAGQGDVPPYWAYPWAGGAALALYLRDHPGAVEGKSVLDLGSGSGLAAIAAARAGAAQVFALEPDPVARVALGLNAEANEVSIEIGDGEALPPADIVLAGDVFYNAEVAAHMLPLLQRLDGGRAVVLIGDPFRRDLPQQSLALLATYDVPDMGGGEPVASGVFRLL